MSQQNRTFSVTSASSEFGNIFKVTSDGQTIDCSGDRGIGLVVFDKDSKNPSTKRMFDFTDPSTCENFCNTVNSIKDGSIIIMGLKGDVAKNLTPNSKKTISTLGSAEINKLTHRDSWAMMSKKGSPHCVQESRKQDVVNFTLSFPY